MTPPDLSGSIQIELLRFTISNYQNLMSLQLVDSHCHLDRLDLSVLGGDLKSVLNAAKDHNVGHMLCVSINLETFPDVIAIAHAHENVFASVGVHPNETDCKDPSIEELVSLASDPKIVAIGETGLDYFRSEGDLNWQRERFCRHISAAKQTGKPLIIHTRDSAADTIKILKDEGADSVGGVMHCFTGDLETAKQAIELGFYISLSGIVTFKSATDLQQIAKEVPNEFLLVETDSPYLTPVPYRGKANQPAYVSHVAEKVADLREITVEELTKITTENFFRLFSSAIAVQ